MKLDPNYFINHNLHITSNNETQKLLLVKKIVYEISNIYNKVDTMIRLFK